MRCKTAGTQADADSVLVLPQICREEVFKMAHSSPLLGILVVEEPSVDSAPELTGLEWCEM